jgi:hypothetical protein
LKFLKGINEKKDDDWLIHLVLSLYLFSN